MTKTITTYLLQLTFLSCVIALALGVNYLSAWSGPPGTFPTCPTGTTGCDAPVNVGATGQIKTGGLTVGSLVTSGSAYVTNNLGISVPSPVEKLEVAGNIKLSGASNGVIFQDGSKQITAASTPAITTGSFGGSATVTLPGTFNLVEIKGMNGAPNGSSTNVLTVLFVTVYNSAGTWKYTTLIGGAGTAYTATNGTLTSGVQVCPVAAGTYSVQFCLTRTAGGSLQINTGAATSQGAAYAYTMQ